MATGLGLHLGARHQRVTMDEQLRDEDEIEDGVHTGVTQAEVEATRDRARRLDTFGIAAVAGGVLAAGVGAYLWYSAPDEPEQRGQIVISPGPDQVGISWVTRF